MNKLVMILFTLLISSCLYSQTTEKKMAAVGTYQLIQTVIPKVSDEVFTTDLLFTIESNRDDSEEKILVIGQYTKVRILSRAVINAPGFVPLTPEIVYTEEPVTSTPK